MKINKNSQRYFFLAVLHKSVAPPKPGSVITNISTAILGASMRKRRWSGWGLKNRKPEAQSS
jgi:hypothetical protein